MEVIYLTPNIHTGQIREASSDLLEATLRIIRQKEELLEVAAHFSPNLMTSKIGVAIFNIPLPSESRSKWNHAEAWVELFLYTTRVMRNPKLVDQMLDRSLPSLDPNDPDNAENFLFGSRERINYLLSKKMGLD